VVEFGDGPRIQLAHEAELETLRAKVSKLNLRTVPKFNHVPSGSQSEANCAVSSSTMGLNQGFAWMAAA